MKRPHPAFRSRTANPFRPLCVPKTLSVLMEQWNRLSWRNDRAVLFPSGRAGLAIQVDKRLGPDDRENLQRSGVISSRAILGGLHHHYVRV
jgi:hypothetical protein